MIDTNRIKGMIAEKGMSQRKVAECMGISEGAFYNKMKRGVFDSDEMEQLIVLLNIQNPADIFFAKKVTQ